MNYLENFLIQQRRLDTTYQKIGTHHYLRYDEQDSEQSGQ